MQHEEEPQPPLKIAQKWKQTTTPEELAELKGAISHFKLSNTVRMTAAEQPRRKKCCQPRTAHPGNRPARPQVFHASAETQAAQEILESTLYGEAPPLQRVPATFAALSCDDSRGVKKHVRFNTTNKGKYLQFGTGPVIRAGPATPADALHGCLSVINYQKSLGKKPMMWAAVTTPNIVGSGEIKGKIDPTEFRKNPQVSYSWKFPGDSWQTDFGVTMEFFLRRRNSKKNTIQKNTTAYISPGIKSEKTMKKTLNLVARVGRTYASAEKQSKDSTTSKKKLKDPSGG